MTTEPVVNRNVYRNIDILDMVRYRLPPAGMVSTHSVSKEKGRTSALLTLATGALLWLLAGESTSARWSGIFSAQWMKVLTFAVAIALAWHAWVGIRDIGMDYVKPVGVRLVLEVFSMVWLAGCLWPSAHSGSTIAPR